MKKLAVFFPGVGYTNDRPLMYYTKVIAKQYGYEILPVDYTGFPQNILGDPEKKKQSFLIAMEQAENILKDVNFDEYEDVLFVSKSIGNLVAGSIAAIKGLETRNIYFTPINETFDYISRPGIMFMGNDDPWADYDEMNAKCLEKGITSYLVEDANHSLEIGDVPSDLTRLKNVMAKVEQYIGDFEE